MSYYETGYIQVNDYINAGQASSVKRLGSYSVKQYNNDFKGLCVLKYSNGTYDIYRIVCGKNPITIDSSKTITQNINDWASAGGNTGASNTNTALYSRYATDSSSEPQYPPYNEPTVSTKSAIMFAQQTIVEGERDIESCNIPIFTVTNNNVSGANKYIENGDDSDADNYEDLHPTSFNTEVWLTGAYPGVYFKTTKEGSAVESGGVLLVQALNNITPITKINEVYSLDKMNYFSYQEYQESGTIQQLAGEHYKFQFECGTDNRDKASVSFHVNKNTGEVTGIVTDTLNNHTIYVHDVGELPDTNDYPDDDAPWNTNPSHNSYSAANTLTQTYEISDANLITLGNFLWSSTFKDNIFGLVNSPIENLVSLKAMPISGKGITTKHIVIGNVDTNVNGNIVPLADGIEVTVGVNKKIPGKFENFIDYSQYDIQVYLPFIGFKQLDPIIYINRKVSLYYYYDCILGNVLAELVVHDKDGNNLIHDVFQGSCGIDIAITATNRGQIENGFINSAISAVSDLAKGNVAGLAHDVFNGLSQEFHSTSNGCGNPSLLNKLDMTARFIIKRPKFFEPNEYGHTVGYPCHQYNTIESFSGTSSDGTEHNLFIKCKNFICSHIDYATDAEKDEIKRLMESGVYV